MWKGLVIVTSCCGPSLGCRPGSFSGEPMRNLPAGMRASFMPMELVITGERYSPPADHLRWKPPVKCFMVADPNPGDGVGFQDADGPLVSGNSYRPIKRVVKQAVEMKSRMLRIDSESLVSTTGRLPNLGGKLAVEFPEAGQGPRFHRSWSLSGF